MGHAERWVSGILEEKLREQRRHTNEKLRPIAEKRLRGEKLTKKDIREAMSVTCWKHFAGCCSLEKKCPIFLSACKVLGADPKEVYKVKVKAVNKYLCTKGLRQRRTYS